MCGICGRVDFENGVRVEVLRKMCDVLVHRGPDDQGMVFCKDSKTVEIGMRGERGDMIDHYQVGLGHCRLSIIDLSEAAHQPMCNENGTVWIVFNGEIYNFRELRAELGKKGHSFKSRSDTEVIVHGYEEWDVDCLNYLRGMFALAIWDTRERRAFLARDRLGKKPLVYWAKDGSLIFASEIKSILQDPTVEKKIDLQSLHNYLTYQYVPSPDTIFEDIKRLPPAHYLIYEPERDLRIQRYWKLRFGPPSNVQWEVEGLKREIRNRLEESVKIRLVSDVPLGAFLSGGIDSSLVVGLMAKATGQSVKTFSIGFDEEGFDELFYARAVSRYFGTEHHEFIVKPNAVEILPKLVWYYDQPFADSSAIPTYYVAKCTRDHVKVVLSGDAGDENFAGYMRYVTTRWADFLSRTPKALRKKLLPTLLKGLSNFRWKKRILLRLAHYIESLSYDSTRNYGEQIKIFNTEEKEELYSPEFWEIVGTKDSFEYLLRKGEEAETDDGLARLLYLDINSYLPEDILVKVDVASMANSLEVRIPFLDHKFMEFVATIPSHFKLRGKMTKYILKEAFADFLPVLVLKRKKMGFGVPLARWFRTYLKDYMYGILLDQKCIERGYFSKVGMMRLLEEHVSMRFDHSAKIWALLFLEVWFREVMDRTSYSNST